MESQDPTVVKQIDWLKQWATWYDSADPSIRPMITAEAENSIVFYQWAGSDGSIHYKAAWKLDKGYPGFVLVPPAINWEQLNPPVAAAAAGHEIGPGQGPVMISIQCTEGSDLATIGVPVGAQLVVEAGTGDWVMVNADTVVARVDAKGVWELAEKAPAQDVWQVSPDKHIVYNEAQLYGGLFTIDKAHPENTEKYWEDTIRGLWNLQFITKGSKVENTAFLNQFPTAEKLLDWINAGNLVDNLWIPVIYPSGAKSFVFGATLVSTDGPIDLSEIAIAIDQPTKDEIYSYSPNYLTGTRYISYLGGCERVLVEKKNINHKNVLSFTFSSFVLEDTTYSGEGATCLALVPEKTGDENLLAATQLIKSFPLRMQVVNSPSGAEWWLTNYDPPLLNIDNNFPLPSEFETITTANATPLKTR